MGPVMNLKVYDRIHLIVTANWRKEWFLKTAAQDVITMFPRGTTKFVDSTKCFRVYY